MTRGQLDKSLLGPCRDSCAHQTGADVELRAHQQRWNDVAARTHIYPAGRFNGRGVVICAGGEKYLPGAYICICMLRRTGSQVPVQIWHCDADEIPPRWRALLLGLPGVELVDASRLRETFPSRILNGWELKCYSIINCSFSEVLLLDADNMVVENPEYLFDTPE